MCLLLETIKCIDGKLENLDFHQARFEHTQKMLFGLKEHEQLSEIIKIPDSAQIGLYRCRVLYTVHITKIEFLPYQFREIKSLRLIEDNQIEYSCKYADRAKLEKLFILKKDSDDIIIVKNGLITDSFAANLVFFDGEKWWTPDSPLLMGTKREKLLSEKIISECRITVNDLRKYSLIGLVNAMIDFKEMPLIPIENIRF